MIRVVIEKSLIISYISGWVVGTTHNHGQKIPFYLYVYSMYRCIDIMLLKLKRFPLFATFIIYPFDRSVILYKRSLENGLHSKNIFLISNCSTIRTFQFYNVKYRFLILDSLF